MAKLYSNSNQSFITLFNSIAKHNHPYTVFSDFVTMSAISIHNAVNKLENLENEYLQIVGKYSKDDVDLFCKLLANFIDLLGIEPRDVLGSLYMELELDNSNTAQFFTPHELSILIAKLNYGDQLDNFTKPFVTLSEPACGAGGMVLAFTNEMLKKGHNPAEKLWVQAIDIDRLAGLMCYLQLALWNIPAQVIIGNTITMKFREIYYTPAHYLYHWDEKLRLRDSIEKMRQLFQSCEDQEQPEKHKTKTAEAQLSLPEDEAEEIVIEDQEDQSKPYKNKSPLLENQEQQDDEINPDKIASALRYAEASQHPSPFEHPEAPVINQPAKNTKKETTGVQQINLFDLFVEHE